MICLLLVPLVLNSAQSIVYPPPLLSKSERGGYLELGARDYWETGKSPGKLLFTMYIDEGHTGAGEKSDPPNTHALSGGRTLLSRFGNDLALIEPNGRAERIAWERTWKTNEPQGLTIPHEGAWGFKSIKRIEYDLWYERSTLGTERFQYPMLFVDGDKALVTNAEVLHGSDDWKFNLESRLADTLFLYDHAKQKLLWKFELPVALPIAGMDSRGVLIGQRNTAHPYALTHPAKILEGIEVQIPKTIYETYYSGFGAINIDDKIDGKLSKEPVLTFDPAIGGRSFQTARRAIETSAELSRDEARSELKRASEYLAKDLQAQVNGPLICTKREQTKGSRLITQAVFDKCLAPDSSANLHKTFNALWLEEKYHIPIVSVDMRLPK